MMGLYAFKKLKNQDNYPTKIHTVILHTTLFIIFKDNTWKVTAEFFYRTLIWCSSFSNQSRLV
jgi:hypothetical protein